MQYLYDYNIHWSILKCKKNIVADYYRESNYYYVIFITRRRFQRNA